MSVESVNNVQVAQPQIQKEKKTGGGGKAWCSAFMPGLGQFLDGRNGAGAGYMGANMALTGLAVAMHKDIYKPMIKGDLAALEAACSKAPSKGKIIGSLALCLVSSGLWIANIVDAYRGNKK